ncbi:uncharacterized protein LOC109715003 [Ananas comosus]|uniref:Uncharacterized protein LOC109715003 n=2 Tax=Ananas comosus TaxID=4615 RepID=A0A199VJ84_ANACO|nr:uncharacterized protein LOC109715003 [Ananas comosus]OAY77068.1 hypothetical protein ACMD2_07238 [Ananas comosus]CAD1819279.1 unnamed protein product [Ananas comosus var. bracteatus]
MEKGGPKEEFVYRVSTAEEWEELRTSGATMGRDLDRNTRCIHLSNLHQVRMVLRNFFSERKDLYLLQIDASKLGEGLIYESADASNYFPHFYGPARSFAPLPLEAVIKAEKLDLVNSEFTCSLLDQERS